MLVTGARGGDGGGRRGIVPIDHAFCLPAFGFFREAEFTWRYWASAAVPFGAEVLHHVASLDVDADVEAARAAGLGESPCATLRVCTTLLKRLLGGSRAGRATPRDLSEALMREEYDRPSTLERLCARALGLLDEGGELSDAGLVEFVQAEAARRGEEYAPPLEFYARLEEAMREEYL